MTVTATGVFELWQRKTPEGTWRSVRSGPKEHLDLWARREVTVLGNQKQFYLGKLGDFPSSDSTPTHSKELQDQPVPTPSTTKASKSVAPPTSDTPSRTGFKPSRTMHLNPL